MADSHEKHKQNEDEEEEEDYMGDLTKFIPPGPTPHPTKKPPKPLPTPSSKPLVKNPTREEQMKRKQLEEDTQTLENLTTAIPQSNIGFKLLKQMGYTPGSGLGKAGGRVDPVGVVIRRGRAGIGREDPEKERVRREKEEGERKRRKEEEMLEEFGVRQKMQWKCKRVVVNFRKAKAVVDQLENREVEVEVEEEEKEGEEEEEEVITEEDLLEILVKLREEHLYCLFCGCQYESAEALLASCPGINEDDH